MPSGFLMAPHGTSVDNKYGNAVLHTYGIWQSRIAGACPQEGSRFPPLKHTGIKDIAMPTYLAGIVVIPHYAAAAGSPNRRSNTQANTKV